MTPLLPVPAYEDWRDTRETLHRFLQVVGKIRLAARAATTGGTSRCTSPGAA